MQQEHPPRIARCEEVCGHYNGQIVINVPAHTPHWSRGPSMVPVAVFRALIMMGGGYNRTLGPEGGAAQCSSQVKHTRGGALLLTAALICSACALQTSDATEPGALVLGDLHDDICKM